MQMHRDEDVMPTTSKGQHPNWNMIDASHAKTQPSSSGTHTTTPEESLEANHETPSTATKSEVEHDMSAGLMFSAVHPSGQTFRSLFGL